MAYLEYSQNLVNRRISSSLIGNRATWQFNDKNVEYQNTKILIRTPGWSDLFGYASNILSVLGGFELEFYQHYLGLLHRIMGNRMVALLPIKQSWWTWWVTGAPFASMVNLLPPRISNHIQYKMLYEITHPFSNFEGATVDALEWKRNFIPHYTGHVITYPCK